MKSFFISILSFLILSISNLQGQTLTITVDVSELKREGALYLGVDGILRIMSEDVDTMIFKTSSTPNLMHLAGRGKKGRLVRHKTIYVKDDLVKITGSISQKEINISPKYPEQLIADMIIEKNEPNLETEAELAYSESYLIHLYSQKNFITNEYYKELIDNAPEEISTFWAFTKIGEYLNTQETVGFDLENQYFTHLQAMDKSKNPVNIQPNPNKYLLLDFSASGCGFCIMDIDKLVDINQDYQDQIELVSLWQDPNYDTWVNSSKKQKDKINWTNLLDENGGIFKAFNIRAFPTYLLIDPSGNVVKKWQGGLTAEKLEKYLPSGDD